MDDPLEIPEMCMFGVASVGFGVTRIANQTYAKIGAVQAGQAPDTCLVA